MKIPFDIKFRPQIESGEYKIETRDGRPARVVCWDRVATEPFDNCNIIALTTGTKCESAFYYYQDGHLWNKANGEGDSPSDLFIITPEPELTEFEKGIKRGFLCAGLEDVPTGIIKDTAKELLELAKKELCKGCIRCTDEYWRGRKEAIEEASKYYHYEGPGIQTCMPSCFYGWPCTNPMRDCINCPRQSTIGINTTTGTSTAKVEG